MSQLIEELLQMIEEQLGEQNFSKRDSKTIREEIEKYITSTNHEF